MLLLNNSQLPVCVFESQVEGEKKKKLNVEFAETYSGQKQLKTIGLVMPSARLLEGKVIRKPALKMNAGKSRKWTEDASFVTDTFVWSF